MTLNQDLNVVTVQRSTGHCLAVPCMSELILTFMLEYVISVAVNFKISISTENTLQLDVLVLINLGDIEGNLAGGNTPPQLGKVIQEQLHATYVEKYFALPRCQDTWTFIKAKCSSVQSAISQSNSQQDILI